MWPHPDVQAWPSMLAQLQGPAGQSAEEAALYQHRVFRVRITHLSCRHAIERAYVRLWMWTHARAFCVCPL